MLHRRAAIGILLAAAIATGAIAQSWPAKPIKVIVPFPAGVAPTYSPARLLKS